MYQLCTCRFTEHLKTEMVTHKFIRTMFLFLFFLTSGLFYAFRPTSQVVESSLNIRLSVFVAIQKSGHSNDSGLVT